MTFFDAYNLFSCSLMCTVAYNLSLGDVLLETTEESIATLCSASLLHPAVGHCISTIGSCVQMNKITIVNMCTRRKCWLIEYTSIQFLTITVSGKLQPSKG
ncbi:hypothetical protein ABZP36_010791 [Zizania latifolia]